MAKWGCENPTSDTDDEIDGPTTHRTNYGNKAVRPWVVGVYNSRRKVKFFIVPDRKVDTLRDIFRRCRSPGNVFKDEWREYSRISEDRYINSTVRHSKWYVDPSTGIHTQGIERAGLGGGEISNETTSIPDKSTARASR